MKSAITCILLSILLLIPVFSFAQDFTVNNFTADFYLSKDGYFDVVEKYELEFTAPKHGIFREFVTKLDFKDENGNVSKREMYLSDIKVPGRTFSTNEILGKRFSDKLTIKIGDKNKLVEGNQQYEIRYRVKNALIFTDSLAQFYWNVKPSEWNTIFKSLKFTVHTPDGAVLSPENCFVYAGINGNTEPSNEFDYDYSGTDFSATSKDDFRSYQGQSVTVLVKLPKAMIAEPNFALSLWKRYDWLGILALIFISIFGYIKLKMWKNRVIPVISYYPPENIDPAMAGVLIDNSADFRDITCLLPYWATKGIIRMEAIPKGERALNDNLKLIKLKELPENAAGYEYNLFHKIFNGKEEVLTSSLHGVYAEPLKLLNNKSKEYYTNKKPTVKIIVMILSWQWAFFSITFLPFVIKDYVDIESGKFITFIIINFLFFFLFFPFLFAYIFNKLLAKNEKGKSVMPELLGFYQFIKKAETNRLKTLLQEDPLYFEKTMPYAVAFNLLKEWTGKFEGLLANSPSWYSSSSGTHFTMNTFAHSFSSSMQTASRTMVTSPSSGSSSSSSSSHSSGGGSSGGGFGGGGGGSW